MILRINTPVDKDKVIDYINKLPDKKYTIEIKVKRENRTTSQNKLYWSWLNCIMDETGEDKDRLHEFFKQKYLEPRESIVFNEKISQTASTTKLDTKEYTEYLNRIQQFANVELGILLPNPQDAMWEEFYSKYDNFI